MNHFGSTTGPRGALDGQVNDDRFLEFASKVLNQRVLDAAGNIDNQQLRVPQSQLYLKTVSIFSFFVLDAEGILSGIQRNIFCHVVRRRLTANVFGIGRRTTSLPSL